MVNQEHLNEKVKMLEKTIAFQNTSMRKHSVEMDQLKKKNQRYKQALEDARNYAKSPKILTEPAKIVGIIDWGLEGDTNDE